MKGTDIKLRGEGSKDDVRGGNGKGRGGKTRTRWNKREKMRDEEQ